MSDGEVTSGGPRPTRRRLLWLTGAATAGVACSGSADGAGAMDATMSRSTDDLFLGLDGGVSPAARQGAWPGPVAGVDVGALGDFTVGAWTFNAGARAIVGRDAAGLYAYSAICTHEHCLLHPPDDHGVSVCPCHGSRFDGTGRRMDGPAVTNLRHYSVAVSAGRVWVDVSSGVSDATRTVPPDAGRPDGGTDATSDTGTDTGTDSRADTGVGTDPCGTGVDVGAVTQFAAGTWTLLLHPRVVVVRDARGIYAYTAVCTHSGCTIGAPDAVGHAVCPCHGSQFDGVGHVAHGPASDPLVHYACAVCAGRLRIDTGTVVDDTVRAGVP